MRTGDFGMFDSVQLKTDLWSTDIDGGEVRLRQGKEGCVLKLGKEPDTVIVEFKIGRGIKSHNFTAVEVNMNCLELVSRVDAAFPNPIQPLKQHLLSLEEAAGDLSGENHSSPGRRFVICSAGV